MTTDDILKHFNEAAEHIQARLGISRQVWYHWKVHGVPDRWKIKLFKMTQGALKL